MNPSTEDYAGLAKDAYVNRGEADGDSKPVTINDHEYKVFDYVANASGFHATAYKQVEPPHGIIIAYRGTDPGHPLTTVQDVAVDAIMVTSKVNPQIGDADRFTEQVLAKAKLQGIQPDQVTVAGHSLGGTLAEVEAYRHHLHGQTFNAYGAAELGLGVPAGGNQIIDNVLADDPVSAAGRHFGMTRTYATTADIDQLRQAGYLDGRHGVGPALHGMRLGDHSIDNFAPDPGKGPSVLNVDNEARATTYAPAIARYRGDVFAVRESLHLTSLPGLPLAGLQATAWGVEGLTTAGVASADALEKVSHTIEREATHAAQSVEHTAHVAANAATRTYDAARTEMAHEAQATGQAVQHGVHATEHALSQGIQASERAAEAARNSASQVFDTVGGWFEHKAPPAPSMPAPANASAVAPSATPISLDQPAHPDHELFRQALTGVHQVDASMGRRPDQHSDNLAGALTVAAKAKGMSRIDEVAIQPDGARAFAAQNHVGFSNYAEVNTLVAINTPLEKSSAAALAMPVSAAGKNPYAESQEQALQSTLNAAPGLH